MIDPIGSNSLTQESLMVATFMSEIAESQISSQEDMVQTAERVESLVVNNQELVELQARQIQQLENKIVQLQEMMSDRDALSEARFRALEERFDTLTKKTKETDEKVDGIWQALKKNIDKLNKALTIVKDIFNIHVHFTNVGEPHSKPTGGPSSPINL